MIDSISKPIPCVSFTTHSMTTFLSLHNFVNSPLTYSAFILAPLNSLDVLVNINKKTQYLNFLECHPAVSSLHEMEQYSV
jgi:hypothetical protein